MVAVSAEIGHFVRDNFENTAGVAAGGLELTHSPRINLQTPGNHSSRIVESILRNCAFQRRDSEAWLPNRTLLHAKRLAH